METTVYKVPDWSRGTVNIYNVKPSGKSGRINKVLMIQSVPITKRQTKTKVDYYV